MPGESSRHPPSLEDIQTILDALERHGVRYALLGGMAMAIHGFPRMTKDVDCIFPVDPENNAKLMAALESMAGKLRFDHLPKKEWLDQGYSTAAEGEIGFDILFVAASKSFDAYQDHICERKLGDLTIKVLDVDGMLMSKQTDREEDIPDRKRLSRLRPG